MTDDEILVKAIKEEIACQDAITRIKVDRCYAEIRQLLRKYGTAGLLALALVGAEEQAKDSQ